MRSFAVCKLVQAFSHSLCAVLFTYNFNDVKRNEGYRENNEITMIRLYLYCKVTRDIYLKKESIVFTSIDLQSFFYILRS